MQKVKIEKAPEKEAQIKSLKSENDVWYFDSDEEFEKFAIERRKDWNQLGRITEQYTYAYEHAIRHDKVFVVMGGSDKSTVNRRRCAGNKPVQNLGEAWAHFYDITFDDRDLCPKGLLSHREALAVIKEKWEEVCGEYDGGAVPAAHQRGALPQRQTKKIDRKPAPSVRMRPVFSKLGFL